MRTFAAFAALSLAVTYALAAPHKTSNSNTASSYSGSGGKAPGGNVVNSQSNDHTEHPHGGMTGLLGNNLLSLGSNNAGNGGHAASGLAGTRSSSSSEGAVLQNAYTGVGGKSSGGSVINPDSSFISIGSNNAGDGGSSQSGDSKSG